MGLVRFLLALCVFAGHDEVLPISLMDGTLAVRAFFVVSGFYMALILNEKYGPGREALFYSNRVLRLLPPYLLVLGLALAALLLLDAHPFTARSKFATAMQDPWTALVLIGANLLIVGQDLLFLVSISPADATLAWSWGNSPSPGAWRLMLLPQGWSLAMELSFYLLAPLLLRRRPALLVALLGASLLLNMAMIRIDPGLGLFTRRFLPTEFFLFLLGAVSYRLLEWAKARTWAVAAGWAGLAGFIGVVVIAPSLTKPQALSAIVVWLGIFLPFIHCLSRSNRADRLLGDLSYPLYLVHFTVIAVAQAISEEPNPGLVLLAGIGTAFVLWLVVDRPLNSWRQRRASIGMPSAGATGSPTPLQPQALA